MTIEVSEDLVKKIAQLSRLYLSDQEVKEHQQNLKKILGYFEKIDELAIDLDENESSSQSLANDDFLRKDQVDQEKSISLETFLEQIPVREGSFAKVPTVIHEDF